jgi:hypothetical protein
MRQAQVRTAAIIADCSGWRQSGPAGRSRGSTRSTSATLISSIPSTMYRSGNPLNPISTYDPANPFNPINQFDLGNPANPINQFNPNNPFNPAIAIARESAQPD